MVALEELTDIWDNYGSMFTDLTMCSNDVRDNAIQFSMINTMLEQMTTTDQLFELDSQVYDVLYTCASVQSVLDLNRDALRLYCQQFAFAPEMVAPCAEILSCADTRSDYIYAFNGGYQAPSYVTYDPPTIASGQYSLSQQLNYETSQ